MTKIAVPMAGNKVSRHFGHCEEFMIFTTEGDSILAALSATPPPHEPGVLPNWLSEQSVELIIAGGIGRRACDLFEEKGIKVISGAPDEHPKTVVQAYLNGKLSTGENLCDH